MSDTLSVLLEELRDDCQNVLQLLARLRKDVVSFEEVEGILEELSTSLVHLRIHASNLQGILTDELDRIRRTHQ